MAIDLDSKCLVDRLTLSFTWYGGLCTPYLPMALTDPDVDVRVHENGWETNCDTVNMTMV